MLRFFFAKQTLNNLKFNFCKGNTEYKRFNDTKSDISYILTK